MKIFITFTLFSLCLLFGNTTLLSLTPEEESYLENKKTITVQNETNWPPFNFNEKGVAKGYSLDYITLIASKIGLKVEVISGYSWSEYMKMLQTDALDLIINISKNPEREKSIYFSDIFLSVKNAIYVNITNQNFNSIEDLNGKTIVMPKDFFTQKFLEKHYPFIKQILVQDQLQALKLLSLGKADATIGKKVVLDYIIQNNMLSNLLATQYIEDKKLTSNVRIGSSKKDKILIDIIKKAQRLITKEERNTLNRKWFGARMKADEGIDIGLNLAEKKYLDQKKSLNICIHPNWMPYEKIEKNNHIGFSSDLMKLVSKKIDTPIRLVKTRSWRESLYNIKNKKCDILPMAGQTTKSTQYLRFTTPYLSSQLVIATKTNEIYINDLGKYMHKNFAYVKGYFFEEVLRENYPNIQLVGFDSLNEALDHIEKGKVFGYVGDAITIMYEIQKNFLGTISIVGRTAEKVEYRIGMYHDQEILENILQKAIQSISFNEIQTTKNNWSNFEHDILIDYGLVWKIVLGSLFTIIILMIFLRKQNILQSEIEDLNRNLQVTIQKEVAKSREKDQTIVKQAKLVNMGEMIGNISHQWRQPLSEINSIVMKIENDFYNETMTKVSLDKNLTKIEDLTEYMSGTIESFNNFFKVDKTTRNFLVSSCVIKVLDLFESSFNMHKIKIDLRNINDIEIVSFEGEFIQALIIILQNAKDALLVNAIKNAHIIITIEATDTKVFIHIIDNALGIPTDIMDKIFEPYFTTKFKSQGIGIGLYMAKMIIEKNMRGILDVQNDTQGANFCIELPLII